MTIMKNTHATDRLLPLASTATKNNGNYCEHLLHVVPRNSYDIPSLVTLNTALLYTQYLSL